MEYKSSAELKSEAKALLKGRWSTGILLSLVPFLASIVYFVIINILFVLVGLGSIASGSSQSGMLETVSIIAVIVLIVAIISLSILISLIQTGVDFVYLDWIRKPEMDIEPINNSFQIFKKGQAGGVVLLYIVEYVFVYLWTLLLVIPGLIKSIAYSQSYYIYKDVNDSSLNNNMTIPNYITESRQLMDGHKGRYFYMMFSFLGWSILATLTLGIGFLWLIPYMSATYAAFYKDLARDKYVGSLIHDEDVAL